MDLLRRYLNRPDLTGPLVRAIEKIRGDGDDGREMVTNIRGRTASPSHRRRILSDADVAELIEAYYAGFTAQSLAERYGVHVSTIKKRLRKQGVRNGRVGLRGQH